MYNLTIDQQNAADKFLGFLLNDEKEFFLFGSAGCGKTYLLKHFINKVLNQYENSCAVLGKNPKKWNVFLTAPTNKAVEVLEDLSGDFTRFVSIQTIYSLLGIRVWDDYSDGTSKLILPKIYPEIVEGLIFVDECSMLPQQLRDLLLEYAEKGSKIVYIGDNYQLAPVNEQPIWNQTPDHVTSILSVPVRNKDQQALIDLCTQMKETVRTKEFKPIQIVPGVIDLLDDDEALNWLQTADFKKSRILSYTNNKAVKYIKLVEQLKNHSKFLRVNGIYINNSHYEVPHRRGLSFYPDQLVQIDELEPKATCTQETGYLVCFRGKVSAVCNSSRSWDVLIAADPHDLKKKIFLAQQRKDWALYFFLKKNVMDLRFPYASTIHKAQGSTFDEVLIDLGSFKVCDDPDVAARLLYVAISRAKHRVSFYGKLPKKYGVLV